MVWVGGMFFALGCLRPALADLQPQQRAPVMLGALRRFFNYVLVAIVLIWLSGLIMYMQIGAKYAPPGWNIMMGVALLMTILFLVIRLAIFPKAVAAVAGAQMPVAAQALDRIRQLVLINLILGVVAVIAVTFLQ
jgi:uncharacterized membrane protein